MAGNDPRQSSSWRTRVRAIGRSVDGTVARVARRAERAYAELGSLVLDCAGLALGVTGVNVAYRAATRLPTTPLVVMGLFLTEAGGSAVAGFLMAARRRQQLVRQILGTLATGSFALSLAYLTLGPIGDQSFGDFLRFALLFTLPLPVAPARFAGGRQAEVAKGWTSLDPIH